MQVQGNLPVAVRHSISLIKNNFNKMNILITGAFGFVGTNLSKAIKTNTEHHLIAVDLFEPESHYYDEYYSWESLDKINKKRIDAVIHLAGKAHDTKDTTDSKTYFMINLGLTQQIFRYYISSTAKNFIFFSSVKAVADEVMGEQLTEDAMPDPKTQYGMSKFAAEQFIREFKLPEIKKVYILRPAMIHGPGNKGNLNLLFNVVRKKIPWPLGSFENKRSFLSIDNLIFIINKVLTGKLSSGTYHMADDESISTNKLIGIISESLGKKTRILKVNKKLIVLIAKIGDFAHLQLNSERLRKLTENYVVSNQKIKVAMNIEKLPVRADDGIRKTIKSFN